MAWLRTYDITTPDGSVDSPAEAADRMNEIKFATQERLDVDHYFPLTGTEVSDLDAGEHRKITLRSITAVAVAALAAAKAYLYHLVTDGELYFKDAAGNTIKLTSGGKILSASLDMKDEDNMASDSAVHTLTQQSSKAYADAVAAWATAEIAAAIAAYEVSLSAYTNKDSDGNAMLINHAYKAATAGMACATGAQTGVPTSRLRGYVGATNNPAGVGDLIQANGGTNDIAPSGTSFLVAKDEYFEFTVANMGIVTIRWKSFGPLSEPVDHN